MSLTDAVQHYQRSGLAAPQAFLSDIEIPKVKIRTFRNSDARQAENDGKQLDLKMAHILIRRLPSEQYFCILQDVSRGNQIGRLPSNGLIVLRKTSG